MSGNIKSALFFFLFILAVGVTAYYAGRKGEERRERQDEALAAMICLNRCSAYYDGCNDACGENAACQEKCSAKDRACVNECRH